MEVKLSVQQKKTSITSSPVIVAIMQDILKSDSPFGMEQEHFWMVGLDHNRNNIKFVELIALGAYNRVNIDCTDVFRMAIYKRSNRVILVHNHPGNSLEPSDDDKNATDCLVKAAELLKINVIDHLIITEDSYFSFADEGLLDEIKVRETYRLLDKNKIEALTSKIIDETKMAEQLKTAKSMKQAGIEHSLIIQITGLEPTTVQEL